MSRCVSGLALCCALLISGCQFFDAGVKGSGVITNQNRQVDEFSSVSFSGGGKIDIVIGETPSLEIECDDNLLELLVTEVVDGRLKIRPSENIQPTSGINVKIVTKNLEDISIAGSGDCRIDGLDEETFTIDIAGSGSVVCMGTASVQKVRIAGSGEIVNDQLTSRKVEVKIAGSGEVRVNAIEELSVSIAGSGTVEYIGSPKISQSIAGSGEIKEVKANVPAEKESGNN